VSYNIQFEQYKNHYAYGEDGKTINTIKKCFLGLCLGVERVRR